MKSLLERKYPNALEIIQETGKIKLQNIDDGDLHLLIEELGNLGYESSINASSDNLIVKNKLDDVIKNLKAVKETKNIHDEIIIAFEDYSYEGKSEVIITEEEDGRFLAYVNHIDAPVLRIDTDEIEDGVYTILDVYEA